MIKKSAPRKNETFNNFVNIPALCMKLSLIVVQNRITFKKLSLGLHIFADVSISPEKNIGFPCHL